MASTADRRALCSTTGGPLRPTRPRLSQNTNLCCSHVSLSRLMRVPPGGVLTNCAYFDLYARGRDKTQFCTKSHKITQSLSSYVQSLSHCTPSNYKRQGPKNTHPPPPPPLYKTPLKSREHFRLLPIARLAFHRVPDRIQKLP
jgi:hypothetical protein